MGDSRTQSEENEDESQGNTSAIENHGGEKANVVNCEENTSQAQVEDNEAGQLVGKDNTEKFCDTNKMVSLKESTNLVEEIEVNITYTRTAETEQTVDEISNSKEAKKSRGTAK